MTTQALLPPQAQRLPPRVLTIQSHVVHGHVGNKCAVLPLQLHGFDVDSVNSVQFSNHTGYPSFKGAVHDGAHLLDLLQGLESNGLIKHTHLLTGYIGSVSLLKAVVQVAAKLREANEDLVYVCDPVMGDLGKLYVKPDLIDAFITDVVPLASVLTPNQTEAQLLTGLTITSIQDALTACGRLHDMGPHTVIITSLDTIGDEEGAGAGTISMVASTRQPQEAGAPQRLQLAVTRIPAYFTGTGDLLTALLLAWLHKCPGNMAQAVETAVSTLQAVLKRTADACPPEALGSATSAEAFAAKELKLVQSIDDIREPVVTVHAHPL